jgi:hypothetical protein
MAMAGAPAELEAIPIPEFLNLYRV